MKEEKPKKKRRMPGTKPRSPDAPAPAPVYRPGVQCPQSSYTEEVGEYVCRKLANGESLTRIAESLGVDLWTIYYWKQKNDSFSQNFAQARVQEADAMDAAIRDIADETRAGRLNPQAARVVMEAYKWRAERLKPATYGAQSQINHVTTHQLNQLDRMAVEDLRALKAKLLIPLINPKAKIIEPIPEGGGPSDDDMPV